MKENLLEKVKENITEYSYLSKWLTELGKQTDPNKLANLVVDIIKEQQVV